MMRILVELAVTLSASAALSVMVKGTAAVALGLLSAWLARRGRAAVRHAVLASVFGVLLALPIVSFMAAPVTIGVPLTTGERVMIPLADASVWSSDGGTFSARKGPPHRESGSSRPSFAGAQLSTLLFGGWLVGLTLFGTRFIIGLLQVRFVRGCGLPWPHGQAIAERLAPRARCRVEVLLHESLPAPMTCGVLRPVVMLPDDAQRWDEKDLERAFV